MKAKLYYCQWSVSGQLSVVSGQRSVVGGVSVFRGQWSIRVQTMKTSETDEWSLVNGQSASRSLLFNKHYNSAILIIYEVL